ncbi:hypothetical protein A9Q95_00290 [Rhodobacterales bacterium 59_46_T64]|nr:hypothetical protein A9Q95_00290 [Rhodobacterales bacterium 59_46_T64]
MEGSLEPDISRLLLSAALLLIGAFAVRRCGFNVFEYGVDLRIFQSTAKARHVAFIATADNCRRPIPRYSEHNVFTVMPRVTRGVMGWCMTVPISAAAASVWLTF